MNRVFDHFSPVFGATCPVCKTAADWPTVLVPIPGTEDDGVCEAKQFHKRCYDLLADAAMDCGMGIVVALDAAIAKDAP